MTDGAKRKELSRRRFLRLMAAASVGTALASCAQESPPTAQSSPTESATAQHSPGPTSSPLPDPTGAPRAGSTVEPANELLPDPTAEPSATTEDGPSAQQAYVGVARGGDPKAITMAALAAIGGIERFVKPGDDVIVKPNICVDFRTYEYAATTNPEVVAALVSLCLGSGAKRVRVMDNPFAGGPESAYARSGIGEAVAAAGGQMEAMVPAKFKDTDMPEGRDISRWPVYRDVLTTDVLIDVPIAKHHGSARLTLAGKNLMGVVSSRGAFHANLGQRIADLMSLVRPQLVVVDAVRMLRTNGPGGGNLEDVQKTDTVIASHDIVAADAYATTLFGLHGKDIPYVKAAADMGLGTLDLGSIKIEEIAL